jgi:hypothetical protein
MAAAPDITHRWRIEIFRRSAGTAECDDLLPRPGRPASAAWLGVCQFAQPFGIIPNPHTGTGARPRAKAWRRGGDCAAIRAPVAESPVPGVIGRGEAGEDVPSLTAFADVAQVEGAGVRGAGLAEGLPRDGGGFGRIVTVDLGQGDMWGERVADVGLPKGSPSRPSRAWAAILRIVSCSAMSSTVSIT